MSFPDHFSAVAAQYAQARPEYPPALFDWIAAVAPAPGRCWEAGCGSGQATRGLAAVFAHVHATDPSAAQVAQAPVLGNAHFVVEQAERCSLPDASVDAAVGLGQQALVAHTQLVQQLAAAWALRGQVDEKVGHGR